MVRVIAGSQSNWSGRDAFGGPSHLGRPKRVVGWAATSNKRMQLTKLRAAPVLQAEVPPCSPAGEMDGGTASQLIRSVGLTMEERTGDQVRRPWACAAGHARRYTPCVVRGTRGRVLRRSACCCADRNRGRASSGNQGEQG